MEVYSSLGAWLKLRRKSLDLTQDALGKKVGISVAMIRRLEADERRPSREVAARLAQILDVPLEERATFLKVARAELGADQLNPHTISTNEPTPPIPARMSRSTLPAPTTQLIGRAHEVAAISVLLQRGDARLVTLTGAGGIGKTRVAFQVASDLADAFADGICFVALAPVSDPALVIPAVAQALGVQESSAQPLLASLQVHLRARQMLLVLDNFEQVIVAAPLVAELLAAASQLTVLVTSRAVLHLYGEREFPVPPLNLPDVATLPDAAELSRSEAVRLFVERAQAVQPDFLVTNATVWTVAQICHRLDGLPLAIELAAARIRLFSPQEILRRLDNPLKLLTHGARDLPARHQTLRATLDWSFNLLPSGEQTLLARLAVFVDEWTLEAAESICGAGDEPLDVVAGIEALATQSLVQRVAERPSVEPSMPRFTMLATIREYALERLEASDEAASVRRRHMLFFRDLAEEAEPNLIRFEQLPWLMRLDVEHPNIRAALTWAFKHDAYDDGLRLATAISPFWYTRGHYREGYQWMQRFLAESSTIEPTTRARALPPAAFKATNVGDRVQAIAWADEGVSLSRKIGDQVSLVYSLLMSGWAEQDMARRAERLDAAIDEARKLGDPYWHAMAIWFKSEIYFGHDDYQARALLEESLRIFRQVGDGWNVGWNLAEQGELLYRHGQYDQAAEMFAECLARQTVLEHSAGIAVALLNLGVLAYDQGEDRRAVTLLDESLARYREAGIPEMTARLLCARGKIALAQDDTTLASVLLDEGLALYEAAGERVGSARALHLLGRAALQQKDVSRARALLTESLRLRRGGTSSDIAESLEELARLAAANENRHDSCQSDARRVALLLGAAAAAREALGIPIPPADRAAYKHTVAVVRNLLDAAAWDAAWAEGGAIPLEQVVTYALGDEN